MSQPLPKPPPDTMETEIKGAKLANEKLEIEIANLRRSQRFDSLMRLIPFITILITIGGFVFTIYQYRVEQAKNRQAREDQYEKEITEQIERDRKDREAAQREFMKPLLEKQLTMYLEASSAVATIATTKDPAKRASAVDTFWRLYQGPLVIVENKEVGSAMVEFGECLDGTDVCDAEQMKARSLALATSMEKSVLSTWKTNPEDFAADKFHYR